MWCLRGGLLRGLIASAILVLQIASVSGQDKASDATDSPAAILKKFVEVNEVWLNPKAEQLSYVLTATIKEKPSYIGRVWIDGPNIRWEMDELDKGSTSAVVIRGDSAAYVKGPEQLLKTKAEVGEIHPFRQGITWKSAFHTIRERGVPSNAKLLERQNVDAGEVVIIEVAIPDQRRFGLGVRDSWLGYSGVAGTPRSLSISRVRLHIRLPEYLPVLEDYPDRRVQFRYGAEPIRFDSGLAPSTITYASKSPEGNAREMVAHFQKYESSWLLEMAKNRQDGVVVSALEVSEVSTAPPDKALFEVPAK